MNVTNVARNLVKNVTALQTLTPYGMSVRSVSWALLDLEGMKGKTAEGSVVARTSRMRHVKDVCPVARRYAYLLFAFSDKM
jgi:hypothetical protein